MSFIRNYVVSLIVALGSYAHASPEIIYDTGSVSVGSMGQYGGTSVSHSQYVGVRFRATSDFVAEEIGGHFGGFPGTAVFGAVLSLPGSGELPDFGELASLADVIAVATFEVPLPSSLVWSEVSAPIRRGHWYALVFGSGLFGAAGEGFAPYVDVAVNTMADSFWFDPSLSRTYEVRSTLAYFGLRGEPIGVPEPASAALLFAGLLLLRKRRLPSGSAAVVGASAA